MNNARKRRRLLALWEKDRKCHWCKCETLILMLPPHIKNRKIPPFKNQATIDHLYSRLHENRGKAENGEEVTVLACWECNNKRCKEEQAALPIEVLRERSKRPEQESNL